MVSDGYGRVKGSGETVEKAVRTAYIQPGSDEIIWGQPIEVWKPAIDGKAVSPLTALKEAGKPFWQWLIMIPVQRSKQLNSIVRHINYAEITRISEIRYARG